MGPETQAMAILAIVIQALALFGFLTLIGLAVRLVIFLVERRRRKTVYGYIDKFAKTEKPKVKKPKNPQVELLLEKVTSLVQQKPDSWVLELSNIDPHYELPTGDSYLGIGRSGSLRHRYQDARYQNTPGANVTLDKEQTEKVISAYQYLVAEKLLRGADRYVLEEDTNV